MTTPTLAEFLAAPEVGPPWQEYVGGAVLTKPYRTLAESLILTDIAADLAGYLHETGEGSAGISVRWVDASGGRSLVPDLSVWRKGALAAVTHDVKYPAVAPDFVVEMLCETARPEAIERVKHHMRLGTQLAWLVDAHAEALTAYRPDGTYSIHRAPDVIDAKPVLRDFQLDLGKLFAVLHEEA